MASNLTTQFDTLLDADEWESIAATLAGYLAPTVARNVIEGSAPFDIPDEAYGLAVMFGAGYSPMYTREIQVGGGLYTADKAMERFGLKQTVTNLGA
ncbi:hypothetical protein [Salarchaeum japonicum]|uniref:hypothetical protein n=1 Tax=Salarchaeum japonicum TaxID=555573 RepID=UPI003C75E7CD